MATVIHAIKWASIPVLLAASLFACCTARYERLVNFAVCVGTLFFIRRAIRLNEYFWATGLVSASMMFTPLALVAKVLLLAGFACTAVFANLLMMTRLPAVRGAAGVMLLIGLSMTVPVAGIAQTGLTEVAPLDWQAKLALHAENTYEPTAIIGFAAYAGLLQELNSPTEWGQGGGAYGKRFASTLAWSGIYSTLAFGLDSALHQDPRYYRSLRTGFWHRSAHALRGTIPTRTDSGGDTLSTWRIGSAYGAAFLSDTWYPARLNTVRHGFVVGSEGLALSFATNMGVEFWPDLKRKVFS